MSSQSVHYYASGNVPMDVFGKDGVYIVAVWPPEYSNNAPIVLWAVPDDIWHNLFDKGIEFELAGFDSNIAFRFVTIPIKPSNWQGTLE